MPAGQAGKKARCPQCKRVLIIPTTVPEQTAEPMGAVSEAIASPSPRNPLLFDMMPAETASPQTIEEQKDKLRALQGDYVLRERYKPPERPLPWPMGIFLYPLSRSSLIILTLGALIPLVLRVFVRLTRALVLAHLMGRFYCRNEERLHWEA